MKTKEIILKELKNRPKCKNWELDDNKFYWDIDDKEIEKLLIKAISKTREETLKEIIREYQDNELDGKGYDFYFSIRAKIDELNKLKK